MFGTNLKKFPQQVLEILRSREWDGEETRKPHASGLWLSPAWRHNKICNGSTSSYTQKHTQLRISVLGPRSYFIYRWKVDNEISLVIATSEQQRESASRYQRWETVCGKCVCVCVCVFLSVCLSQSVCILCVIKPRWCGSVHARTTGRWRER